MTRDKSRSIGVRFIKSEAFTLMEITLAVLILATSLTVFLGLHSSSMRRAVRDRNMQQAMLMARRILASLEVCEDELQEGAKERVKPQDIIGSCPDTTWDSDEESFREFLLDYQVMPWDINTGNDPPLWRLTLRIYAEEYPQDRLEVVYFLPREI